MLLAYPRSSVFLFTDMLDLLYAVSGINFF